MCRSCASHPVAPSLNPCSAFLRFFQDISLLLSWLTVEINPMQKILQMHCSEGLNKILQKICVESITDVLIDDSSTCIRSIEHKIEHEREAKINVWQNECVILRNV